MPMMEFSERLQQWLWIGHGQDSDVQLGELCENWLKRCKREDFTSDVDKWAVPPPRMYVPVAFG
jgi:NFRKB Winged Helix-like